MKVKAGRHRHSFRVEMGQYQLSEPCSVSHVICLQFSSKDLEHARLIGENRGEMQGDRSMLVKSFLILEAFQCASTSTSTQLSFLPIPPPCPLFLSRSHAFTNTQVRTRTLNHLLLFLLPPPPLSLSLKCPLISHNITVSYHEAIVGKKGSRHFCNKRIKNAQTLTCRKRIFPVF